MNDNSVWPVVIAVMVVLAVAVCLAMAGDIYDCLHESRNRCRLGGNQPRTAAPQISSR